VKHFILVLVGTLLVSGLGCGKKPQPARGDLSGLVTLLKEGDDSSRAGAASALGDLGPGAKTAVPALAAALRDEYEGVREQAARALGQIGPDAKAAVPALQVTLRDTVDPVRLAAADALKKIDPAAAAKAGL
jgi:HEAT repeat protein